MAIKTDESTDGTEGGVKKEVTSPAAPTPKPKTPEEMDLDPKEAVSTEIVDKMGADKDITDTNKELHDLSKMAWEGVPAETAQKHWDSITGGATHKISKCMEVMRGKVDDPGAFCGGLAKKVGYKPE